jgi:hypothetical protein
MKWLALSLFLLGTLSWSGCATHRESGEHTGQVLYYDRNGDGRVDLERHHFPGLADADWELRYDNHDGWYERKILYGYAVKETAVHLPVPTNVHIEPKP